MKHIVLEKQTKSGYISVIKVFRFNYEYFIIKVRLFKIFCFSFWQTLTDNDDVVLKWKSIDEVNKFIETGVYTYQGY